MKEKFNEIENPKMHYEVERIVNGWLVHTRTGGYDKTVFCDTHDSVIDYCHIFIDETLGERNRPK